MQNSFLKIMGVINLTPNSFFQPSQQTDAESCLAKIQKLREACDIIDLGAESTAPKSRAITFDEEVSRFDHIAIPALQIFFAQHNFLPWISIDTYRPETFDMISKKIRQIDHNVKLIWNDISGIFDQSILDIINSHPENYYIYCHNRVPIRDESCNHLEYALSQPTTVVSEIITFFNQVDLKFSNKVWFDVNLGFAKSRSENHELLKSLNQIFGKFPHRNWVVGLSHKSFLKFFNASHDHLYREILHFYFLTKLKSHSINQNIIARVHDPHIVQLVGEVSEFINI